MGAGRLLGAGRLGGAWAATWVLRGLAGVRGRVRWPAALLAHSPAPPVHPRPLAALPLPRWRSTATPGASPPPCARLPSPPLAAAARGQGAGREHHGRGAAGDDRRWVAWRVGGWVGWVPVGGCWLVGAGWWVLAGGCWLVGAGWWVLASWLVGGCWSGGCALMGLLPAAAARSAALTGRQGMSGAPPCAPPLHPPTPSSTHPHPHAPAEADRDGDGEVNEEEFFRIMKSEGGGRWWWEGLEGGGRCRRAGAPPLWPPPTAAAAAGTTNIVLTGARPAPHFLPAETSLFA